MKKTISIMTVSLLTATTVATASPSKTIEFGTLNKSDSHMLFGQSNQNIVTLGQDEMKKTEGEFWPIIVALLVGFGSNVANAPSHNDRVYNGPIGSPSTWW